MELRVQKKYFWTGSATALVGFLVALIGSGSANDTWMQATYTSDFYWALVFAILGAGLMLIGLAIIILGTLRYNRITR